MSGTTGTLEAVGAYLGAAREEVDACSQGADWREASALAKVTDRIEQGLNALAYVAQIMGDAGEVA